MATTLCLTVMQEDSKRGGSSRRQPRLPTIAPKDDQASSTSSSRSSRPNAPTVPPRARLPPRSRTGCWTCRTRKVKCDEGRPICGQCGRLGHSCDYNPRLSFRDDTLRVVERMQDVTVAGSAIWDRVASPAPSSVSSAVDDLAPFATLLTDEDRERKAEASPPGTFNVIVNPDSFQHLAEYTLDDVDTKTPDTAGLRRSSIAASLASSLGRDSNFDAVAVTADPNIVILTRFEDLTRRVPREFKSPTSPISAVATLPPIFKREESDEIAPRRGAHLKSLRHFRDHVWKALAPPEHGPDSSIGLLDEAAAKFPPLVKAMMALGALSLFRHDGLEKIDSLQHYSQALPELQVSLKSEEDLASDGAFLTHFLMLVYEIAASDNKHLDIWSHHVETLLRIALLRRQIFGAERFPYICWWICNIDLEALLGGSGNGVFVGHMLNHDLIPPPSFHLFPLGDDGSSVVYPEETQSLPIVLQLDYEVTLHATRLGLLAREFRSDNSFEVADIRQKTLAIKIRRSRTLDIQDGLRHLWTVPAVQSLAQMQLPIRSQRLFHHAWTMYRGCIIYSHTSMWPGQRADLAPDFDSEITAAAQQILQVGQAIVAGQGVSPNFLIFPLFMAGYASTAGNQRLLAQELISIIEKQSLGRNISATKSALDEIYSQQNERFLSTGQSLDIDWLEVIAEKGLSLVNFGL